MTHKHHHVSGGLSELVIDIRWESIRFSLPFSKMTGTVSDLYWVRSRPMDYRPWISPQLYAPPTFAMYKENRDPAVEAVLRYVARGKERTRRRQGPDGPSRRRREAVKPLHAGVIQALLFLHAS